MPNKPNHQRKLINEAKLRVRGIGKEIADLKRERYTLERFIRQAEYIAEVRKQQRTNKWQAKLKYGQQNKKDMLHSAIGGVRAH